MNKKYLLLTIGTLSLIISLVWGLSKDQTLEPWTAFLAALLYVLGLLINSDAETDAEKKKVNQSNFFGFGNKSSSKKASGKVNQRNWFGANNEQEVDNS